MAQRPNISEPPCIMLVESDPTLAAALRFRLRAEGYAVELFDSARAVLASRRPVACFVLEQRLPDMSGLDLLDALRRRGVATPAILLATQPAETTLRRASAAGVLVLEKPLIDGALVEAIRAALEGPSGTLRT